MKKLTAVLTALVVVCAAMFAFAGCTNQSSLQYDIVLLTDGASVDDGAFNQSAWEGVERYAEEAGMTYRYYQPDVAEDGTVDSEVYASFIELAVQNGAKFIVCPGEALAVAVYENAPQYADTNFILLDAYPHAEDSTEYQSMSNVMSVSFSALESGFLAGYMSVMSGNTKLGYIGSLSDTSSTDYGAGFVQGASYAANALGTPVTLDYAYEDASDVDFDYSMTVEAVYEEIDADEEIFTVKVVNGSGSGNYYDGDNVEITADPAPEGKVFDKWVCTSNTEGVSDRSISITSSSDTDITLIVNDASCTVEATYRDADSTTYALNVENGSGSGYFTEGTSCTIEAQPASSGMRFDHWEVSDGVNIADVQAAQTQIEMPAAPVDVQAVYVESPVPVFDVQVIGGTGSGAYAEGDVVRVVADEAPEGNRFSHWANYDAYGNETGVAFDNEYYFDATFTMLNRYEGLAEKMFNTGVTSIYTGGNDSASAVYNASGYYDFSIGVIGSEVDCSGNTNCVFSTVKELGNMAYSALKDFRGGEQITAGCAENAISLTGLNIQNREQIEESDQAMIEVHQHLTDTFDNNYKTTYEMLANGAVEVVLATQPGVLTGLVPDAGCLSVHAYTVQNTAQQ